MHIDYFPASKKFRILSDQDIYIYSHSIDSLKNDLKVSEGIDYKTIETVAINREGFLVNKDKEKTDIPEYVNCFNNPYSYWVITVSQEEKDKFLNFEISKKERLAEIKNDFIPIFSKIAKYKFTRAEVKTLLSNFISLSLLLFISFPAYSDINSCIPYIEQATRELENADLANAFKNYEKAIEESPDCCPAYQGVGGIAHIMNRDKDALIMYNKAIFCYKGLGLHDIVHQVQMLKKQLKVK